MRNKNLLVIYLYTIVFLIPFYRVQLQYDFRFYVGVLYVCYLFSTGSFFIKTNQSFTFKNHLAFYAWAIITTFFTVNPDYSIQYLSNYFFLGLFFLLLVHYINSYNRAIIVSKAIVASFFVQMFIVFMQYLDVKAFYLNDVENLGLNTGMAEASTGTVRFWGSFGEALVLSTYLTTVGVGLIVYLLANYRSKLLTYIILGCILFSIYLTGSRGGMSIFIVVSSVYLVRARIVSKPIFGIALALLILGGYYYFNLVVQADANLARFNQLRDGDMRFKLWTEGFKIIADSPWVGSTIGCLNYSLKKYNLLPDYVFTMNASGHVENSYLTILFSTGVIGFIFFISIVRYPLRLIKKYRLNALASTAPYRTVLRAYTYSYVALLLCMFTEPSVGVHARNTMLFMLVSGLLCCLATVYSKEQRKQATVLRDKNAQPSIDLKNVSPAIGYA